MQLEFEIVLHDDAEITFENHNTGRRIVVTKFGLQVPKLKLTSEEQMLVNENFLKLSEVTCKKRCTPAPAKGMQAIPG